RYDQQPRTPGDRTEQEVLRTAERGGTPLAWKDLPGTATELDAITALFPRPKDVLSRRGSEAGTQPPPAGPGDPKQPPRWAHFATHGFFADPSLRSVFQIDEQLFQRRAIAGERMERVAAGARNPQVLSGLVLAGANLAPPKDLDQLLHDDGG